MLSCVIIIFQTCYRWLLYFKCVIPQNPGRHQECKGMCLKGTPGPVFQMCLNLKKSLFLKRILMATYDISYMPIFTKEVMVPCQPQLIFNHSMSCVCIIVVHSGLSRLQNLPQICSSKGFRPEPEKQTCYRPPRPPETQIISQGLFFNYLVFYCT